MLNHPPREDEQTSWLWVGLWTLSIFATIPVARSLQQWVTAHGARDGFLVVVFIAVVVGLAAAVTALIHSGLHRDRSRMVWLVIIAGVYAWLTSRLRTNPEEALHFVQYGVLALLIFRALVHRYRDRAVYLSAFLICVIAGMMDEFVQWIIPRRFFDFRDILLNAQGGGLMVLAIAFGLKPSYIEPRFDLRSLRVAVRLLIAMLILFFLFFSNTGKVKAWYREFIPDVHKIDEVMAEYGYRIVDDERGLIFFSRLDPAQLIAEDQRRGAEEAPIISDYRHERSYGHFLHRYQPYDDPYMHEARVHFFRRDRYATLALRSFEDEDALRDYTTIAYREDQLMRAWFPELYRHSAYAWPEEIREGARALADLSKPYTSPVSAMLFTAFGRLQAQLGTGALIVLAILWLRYLNRRLRSRPEPD
jgi:VanZ family protein